jgi:beta-galactosidase/beta-glucuronidase
MRNFLYFCLILASCTSPPDEIRETISLAGEWTFRVDSLDLGLSERWYKSSFDEQVNLPGSMAGNGKGDEVTLATDWVGNIVDSSYFHDEKFRKYRQPDNFKIPFWLKPVKHYMGPAWYQKQISLPDDWQGRRVVLSLERCHWESRVFVNDLEAGHRNSLAVPHTYDITAFLIPGVNNITG